MHGTILLYIGLLAVILFLVMLAQRIRLSYPIVLVLGGLMLSFIPGLPHITIDPELIFVIFLPPLLYEAAWQTSWKELWRWRRVISSFAFLIVIVTSLVVAIVSSHFIPGFTLALGFLLGGIISPPDAVAATSVLKGVKVPRRLLSIVEGESLLNDASSLIVFRFALIAVDTGHFVFREAALSFVIVVVMGIVTGIVIAMVFYAIHRWLPTTPNINVVLSFIAPYLMYIIAEQFHFSGVLAVVSGGLFLSIRSHVIFDHRSRFRGESVWSTIGFALNGLVFMLIGLQLPVVVRQLGIDGLEDGIKYGLFISATLIVLRLLCTFGASAFTRVISHVITTADSNPGWKGPVVFGWAGMRGVVSLAAAMSIPLQLSDGQPFPQRNLILFITFMVILVTLVFQGLTLPLVARWVNMEDRDFPMGTEAQELRIRKKMSQAALNVLNEEYAAEITANELLQVLHAKLQNDTRLSDRLQHPGDGEEPASVAIDRYREIYAHIIARQRQLLEDLNKKAEVDEVLIRKLSGMLDLDEEKIRLMYGAGGE